jgi:hypothetical protein
MSLLDEVKKKATKELKKQAKGSKHHKKENPIEKMAKKELKKRFKI